MGRLGSTPVLVTLIGTLALCVTGDIGSTTDSATSANTSAPNETDTTPTSTTTITTQVASSSIATTIISTTTATGSSDHPSSSKATGHSSSESTATSTIPTTSFRLFSKEMEWGLVGILVVLIIIAVIIAVCLVCKQRNGQLCAKCLVAKGGDAPGIEEVGGVNVSFTDLLQAEEGLQPNPRRRNDLRIPPDGSPALENGAAVTNREEEGGSGSSSARLGPVARNRKSVYSIFRQSMMELDDVQTYLVDRLEFGQLADDFKTIPVCILSLTRDVAVLPDNKKKNRFTSVLPYDKNRVILNDGYKKEEATDYVNASYIEGYRAEKAYIAAQGPKDITTGCFWRMIWQEKVTHIVMLTNVRERGRDKCHQYWPDMCGQKETYGPVSVTMTSVDTRATFTSRTFTVTTEQESESREVTQFHYVAWPDFGVPLTASLVSFWRYVTRMRREVGGQEFPLVVHCSAGVGRSGTFIALDIAMQQCVTECKVDLLQLVTSLRHQRCLMVQAVSQFEFLHTALLEAFTSRESIFPVDEMNAKFTSPIVALEANSHIDQEFRMLMEMKALTNEVSCCTIARRDENRAKNRDPSLLPADDNIAFLNENVKDRGEYINAVYMPTFHSARGSLVTQLPLPSTLVDFWRLVYGNRVTTIVSLTSPNEEDNINSPCQFWPLGGEKPEELEVPPYSLHLQSMCTVASALQSYTLSLRKKGVSESREVEVLHYTGWSGKTAGDVSDILYVIDTLKTLPVDRTYLVQCTDGVRKSGLFCTLCDVVSRMTYDQEVDVYMSVRHIQSVSPHAVSSLIQYRYIYEVAQRRSEELSLYVNEVVPSPAP